MTKPEKVLRVEKMLSMPKVREKDQAGIYFYQHEDNRETDIRNSKKDLHKKGQIGKEDNM